MHMKLIWIAAASFVMAATGLAAEQGRKTVVYDGIASEVKVSPEASNDLWVTLKDLTHATRFVVKP
ncbi:MAG TPA: redoxin domain-containing (seleno)protein, partial [Blastocatellia bacterium]